MKKIAIITTHPIQYNAPFFKMLSQRGKVQLKVFYTWPQAIEGFKDKDFGKNIQWDIPLLEGYDWEGVENISKNPSSKKWNGIDCPELINQIKLFDPNAIMVYGWNLKSHFKAMRYFKGNIPVWFFGDSTLLDEKSGWKKVARRIWLSWVYRHIDKAFYVGTNNKNYFLAHGVKDDQLVFYPHAIDNERFADDEKKQYKARAQHWRKELGYAAEDKVILFAGKFEPKKNPKSLVEAVRQVNQAISLKNKTVKLLLVGNGQLENELEMMIEGDPNIKLMSFQNQSLMPIIYRIGDVYCLPSQGPGETWGLAINEAMACSRPVIASDRVGCAKDLVIAGKTGYIFKSTSQTGLSDRIKEISYNTRAYGQLSFEHITNWSYLKKCEAIEKCIVE